MKVLCIKKHSIYDNALLLEELNIPDDFHQLFKGMSALFGIE
jgi:hypothetical protein